MKVAVIGSRGLGEIDVAPFVPANASVIISGGARGIDTAAARYARAHGLELVEIRPDYRRYGRGAPLRRNREIVDQADLVIAVWDGRSSGTRHVIDYCRQIGKTCAVHEVKADALS